MVSGDSGEGYEGPIGDYGALRSPSMAMGYICRVLGGSFWGYGALCRSWAVDTKVHQGAELGSGILLAGRVPSPFALWGNGNSSLCSAHAVAWGQEPSHTQSHRADSTAC